MVLFIFGRLDDSWVDSWILGNDVFTTYRHIDPMIAKAFDDGTLSAKKVLWGSLGQLGNQPLCFFKLQYGLAYFTQIANLKADVTCKAVEHLTFSPGGGWFIRYTDGTVRLSMTGTFPNSFHRLAKGHMETQGTAACTLQYSDIKNVFFGAGETILIQLTNGGLMWEDLPEDLVPQIRSRHTEGWMISTGTCFSPNSDRFYAVEWKKPLTYIATNNIWSYWIPLSPGSVLNTLLVREVIEGVYPASYAMESEPTPSSIARETAVVARETFQALLGNAEYMTRDEFKLLMQRLMKEANRTADNAYYERLWDLSDVDGNGKISLDEFTLALSLIQRFDKAFPDKIPVGVIKELKKYQEPKRGLNRVSSIGLEENLSKMLDEDLIFFEKDEKPAAKPQPSIYQKDKGTSNSQNPFREKEKEDKNEDRTSRSANEKQLRESLMSSIVKENPNVQWEDVAGLDAAKEELQEAVVLPIKFPQMFSGKRKPRRGILLYGPPGTGKSYLAKAVATEVDSTLFSISSSDVMSKWYGESESLVKTLFEMARENKPSIIFIDELDALCGARDGLGANEHTARMKTELMVQIDGVGNDNTGVLLLAATNLPWSLDPAMRRRFQRKIHIALPDEEARSQMFKIHVGDTPCGLTEKDYNALGKMTKGLSGSDISNAVQDALMQPVKKISSSKYWRKINIDGKEKWTPCKADTPGAVQMNWRKVPTSQLHEPIVEAEDFFTVLSKVKPSVSEKEIVKCIEWTKEFGLEGA